MNIYDIPCPTCGDKIVSTARMRDDEQAPTNCASGHTFMRAEALRKQQTKNYYTEMRELMGPRPLQIKASQRLKELHDELGTMRWLGTDEGWDLAIEAVQKRIKEMGVETSAAQRLRSSDGSAWEQNVNSYGMGELVNASLHKVVAERVQDYVKRLKKMGIKQLGSGNFADVFQHPTMPNVVVKLLTENDDGYEAYVKFAQHHAGNKYCPKILQVVEADNVFEKKAMFDMRDLRLVFMEKLEPIHYNKYIDFGEHVVKCAGIKPKKGEHLNVEKMLLEASTWDLASKQTKDKDLAALASFIYKTHSHSIQIDMHDGNVMMRGNQVVVTDPFSTY